MDFQQDEQPQPLIPQHQLEYGSEKKYLRLGVALGVFVLVAAGIFFFWQGARTLTVIQAGDANVDAGSLYPDFRVKEEPNRIDVLLMAIRGSDDPNGGLLTDSMILISFDTETKKAAMISIPRDLYVFIPPAGKMMKINAVYETGEKNERGGGLILTKQAVSYITGVYVDYAAVVDFDTFSKTVDAVGGVTVKRTTTLIEDKQWTQEGREDDQFWHIETSGDGSQAWVFEVPIGTSTLDSFDALYYARSRYTTSDFDRMKRQQEIINQVAKKMLSLGVLSNPFKVSELMDIIGKSVKTDISSRQILNYLPILQENASAGNVAEYVLDTSTNSFLMDGREDNQYVLLPRSGNFDQLRVFIQSLISAK
ncbi:MAG: LCP family protein [Candidatus Spechtbacteria bacterium]|nr:LCP family protein [Candidatus Spechtbacteria bacterium]